jgi:hypothetical protein
VPLLVVNVSGPAAYTYEEDRKETERMNSSRKMFLDKMILAVVILVSNYPLSFTK